MRPAKIGIISLGCARNLVDSEKILGRLAIKGYEIVDIEKADIGLVNTCAFIEDAKKESVDAILDLINLKNSGRLKKIIVAGCLVERYKEELLPHLRDVDAFFGRIAIGSDYFQRYPLVPGHLAYVKISEGCNHTCSFCVIPKIKGPLKSRSISSILREVRRLDEEGKREINIIGQDVSLYGLDLYNELRLGRLLKNILRPLKNVRWVRLLYLHPNHLTGELVSLIVDEPKICKYIDLPLQHINSRILRAMNRKPGKNKIRRLLRYLRKKIPGVGIRTTLIVGFPGESEKEFKELLNFIEEEKFERLGVFKYSPQEWTPAYNFSNQIPEKIKRERYNTIMRLQQEISGEFNAKLLGSEQEVLIEEKDSEGTYLGRLSIDAPEIDGAVYVKTDKSLKAGEFVRARIIDTYEYDLVGELAGGGIKG